MKIFDANITPETSSFLKKITSKELYFEDINDILYDVCGIKYFFENEDDKIELINNFLEYTDYTDTDLGNTKINKIEYGDFQTNINLANNISNFLLSKNINPKILIEPTCGKGNFIIASLSTFKSIKKIYAIEIYKPYIWETKFNILDFYLSNKKILKPDIYIIHKNIFDFSFNNILKSFDNEDILIIGNPPWITNSQLSIIGSSNLPKKTNLKNHTGIDVITGKGNFDISENIIINILNIFQNTTGYLAFLVKNSVIKNILLEQKNTKYRVSEIEKYSINSKKEFDVSVESSLLFCKFNSDSTFQCNDFDFYTQQYKSTFGWIESKFASNIISYQNTKFIDGVSSIEWRQGIKHDCSQIMELQKIDEETYINGLSEKIYIENDLVYGLLKSSDLKNKVIQNTRKHIIITQKKVGLETNSIEYLYPNTYNYLKKHILIFQNRKSIIYKGKPNFSIFGVGDYSFKNFKVAISSLYNNYQFTLILPQNNKPIMLDDTCYFLGFDEIEFAIYTMILLNLEITIEFLKSITFSDAKRVFTKDVLMRVDFLKIIEKISIKDIQKELENINKKHNLKIDLSKWNDFIIKITPKKNKQYTLFP